MTQFDSLTAPTIRVGICGTGFSGSGLTQVLPARRDMTLARVLTRRTGPIAGIDPAVLTDSVADLIDHSDIIVECSGDVDHGARVILAAFAAGKPVVTIAAELHVSIGSYFVDRGIISEAEGDQPGSIAALAEEARSMGFEPRAYGNIKGYLNHTPTLEDMTHWSGVNGTSLVQTTSFTDGTKLQIEQSLVANGLGATIAQKGLLGPKDEALLISADRFGQVAKAKGQPIADYVVNRELPAGVFVVSEHHHAPAGMLRYLKLGPGPFYTLLRPYHLCHLEALRTIERIARGGSVLLNNSPTPTTTVCAIAKRDLASGTALTGTGSFDTRGEAVTFAECPDAVPIPLLAQARLTHSVATGQTIVWSDVELPDNEASRIGRQLYAQRISANP